MRYLSSPHLYTCSHKGLLQDAVLVLNADNTIIDIIDSNRRSVVPTDKIEYFDGALVPGLINTHCHLELSYLKNKIPRLTGLDGFIKTIEIEKSQSKEWITQAAIEADVEMYRNGIVAVGDICNTNHTLDVKLKSALYYHNFIETYAFDPSKAEQAFSKAQLIKTQFQEQQLAAGIVPHAPYSVSYELFKYIDHQGICTLSMHNQESEAENDFFKFKSGPLIERLQHFGININHFVATGKNALPSVISRMNRLHTYLLVHNTVSQASDLEWMQAYTEQVYWCFCPKANLYIENKLPHFNLFKQKKCTITLGTDSLASNNNLDLLDELKTILLHNDSYTFEELIYAACMNGAEALGISNKFGSFEIGKQPGVLQIDKNLKLVQRIA
jgi:aminodeoxyfutalosine deaminase